MKAKILAFLGLIIAILGVSFTIGAPSAHAQGEQYRWINANTIEAKGGLYEQVDAANGGVLTFPRKGNVFEVFSSGSSCDVTLTITPTPDNKRGQLTTKGCDGPAAGFDKSFNIANPEKGPPLAGSNVNYATVNCAQQYPGNPDEKMRCDAVKACVVTAKKTKDECLSAWATCITNHTNNGAINQADKQGCADKVAAGDLAGAQAPPANTNPQDKTTCAVVGVGWIICPVVTFLAKIVDGAYGFVASLLMVQPLLTTGQTQGVYEAWSVMRNFANVGFVIVFLIIIFSQITSLGISNYGLKKLLPKFVVTAILVNASFWIWASAIDASNIVGVSIHQILNNAQEGLRSPNAADFGATGNGWEGIAGGILAGTLAAGALLYVTLSALLPILIAALLAIVTTFLILTLRQVLLILLVVASPLIFLADLLPNTQDTGKKGRKLGTTLLLLFPIISLVFGGSALASTIIMGSANGPYKIAIQLMGAGATAIPLFLTTILMNTTTGVLNRFGAFVNNPNKGPFDRMRKGAERYSNRRKNVAQERRIRGTNMFREGRFGQERIRGDGSSRTRRVAARAVGAALTAAAPVSAVANWRSRAQMNTDLKTQNAEKALAQTKQDYVADRIAKEVAESGSSKYAQTIAGPTGDVNRIQMAAIAAKKNEVAQAIKDAQISADIPPGEVAEMGRRLAEAVAKDDDITARAMQNMLMTSGSAGLSQYRDTMTSIENSMDPNSGAGEALRKNMLENHTAKKADAKDLIQQAVTGDKMSAVSNNPGTWKLPDAELVRQKEASLQLAINSGAITREQAIRINTNEDLAQHLDPAIRAQIKTIAT